MNDHLRPAHPGCGTCKTRLLSLTNLDGDLGHVKLNLIRAQDNHPENEAQYVSEIKALKAKRAAELEVYRQHYVDAHPSFADNDAPFAKSPAHKISPDQAAEIRDLLRDGEHTYAEIAEVFDVSPSTIQYYATRAGLTTTDLKTTASASTPDAVTDAEGEDSPSSPSASPLPLLGSGLFPDWMDRGLCHETDPEAFFPDKGGSTREAKAICARCPVQAECLDYALDHDERFGIWGGLSERERRKVKRAMQAEAGADRVPCPRCDQTFDSPTALAAHQRHHDRPPLEDLPCPHCDHIGRGRAGLSVHISRSHPQLRNAS